MSNIIVRESIEKDKVTHLSVSECSSVAPDTVNSGLSDGVLQIDRNHTDIDISIFLSMTVASILCLLPNFRQCSISLCISQTLSGNLLVFCFRGYREIKCLACRIINYCHQKKVCFILFSSS